MKMKSKVNSISKLVLFFLIFASTAFSQTKTETPPSKTTTPPMELDGLINGFDPNPGQLGIDMQLEPNSSLKVRDLGSGTPFFEITSGSGQVKILKSLHLENTSGTGKGVIYFGTEKFLHNYGNYNTFLGAKTGSSGYGINNVGIGYSSLQLNTGTYNTGVGAYTLPNNTGQLNTAMGYFSLYANSTGSSNSAFGSNSLSLNANGAYNTAVGTYSLSRNQSGSNNTAVGYLSLYNNSVGVNDFIFFI